MVCFLAGTLDVRGGTPSSAAWLNARAERLQKHFVRPASRALDRTVLSAA